MDKFENNNLDTPNTGDKTKSSVEALLEIEERVRIKENHSQEKQTYLENTKQNIKPILSERQLGDFKSGSLDISHFSSKSLQILIGTNFKGKDKELLNTIKNWSLDSKIGNHLLNISDITSDPLLKKLSAKYISLQIQKRAKKITISGKEYLTVSKRNFSGNEKKLFETKLGKDFISYSDKVLKVEVIEDFKQKKVKVQKELKELEQSSKWEIGILRQKHFKNAMVIHEPTADIMRIQRRVLKQKYEIEKTFAKEYIKTTILLSDDPKLLKIEKQAYGNIDYRNWNGSKLNPNVDDILRDSFSKQFQDNIKKMWEDFQKDPLVGIFDVGKIIGAGTIAGVATILSGGNPIVGGIAFTASDNAIGYIGHGTIGAIRGEGFVKSGNKSIGLYKLDENGNIKKKNGEPVFKKGEVIAVEKFGEVAMGIMLMGPISKVGGTVAESIASKGYNTVVSKGIGLGAEALTFNSINVPFNPMISGISTIADTKDLEKGNQALKTGLKQSISPINFLNSYIHNVAFIGALRAGNKLGGEFVAKKFQTQAMEIKYNSLKKNYEVLLQKLNTEMQELGFGVIKEGIGYELVDGNGEQLKIIPKSIQAKQVELDKIMAEIVGLGSTIVNIKEEKQEKKDIWYHGTTKVFQNFDIFHMREGNVSTKTPVLFFTKDINFANDYTKINDFTLDELNNLGLKPNVRPVNLSFKNPWDYKNPDHRKILFDKVLEYKFGENPQDLQEAIRMTNMMLEYGSWRWIEPHFEFIKGLGFDAIKFTEQGKDNIAVFENSQISSIFDTKNKN